MNRSRLRWLQGWVEWPLPQQPWQLAVIVLVAATLPFAVDFVPDLTSPHLRWTAAAATILAAFWSVVVVVIMALLIREEAEYAIIAKRLGVSVQIHDALTTLDSNPWLGFGRLLAVLLFVALIVALSASSITYSAIAHFNWAGPFGAVPASYEVLIYFIDQALKGVVFDFMEVFELSLPNRVRAPAHLDSPFLYLVVVYRLAMALLTLQILWLALTYWRAQTDDEVTLAARHHAVQVGMRFQQQQYEERNRRGRSGWLPRRQWQEYQQLKDQKDNEGWLDSDDWARFKWLSRKKGGKGGRR